MQTWETSLENLIAVLGDNPTEEQQNNLSSWIIENVPKAYWHIAQNMCSDCGDLYTEMSMRRAECGLW